MATSTRPFTPLPDIESPEFTKQYELGVWRRMHGEEQGCGLVAVSYLVTNLKRYAQRGYFTSPDPSHLHHIGFFLGMYHGSILSPQTGEPRPEVTMLARLDHEQARRGYTVGREFCFVEATPDERRWSESGLVARLRENVGEMAAHHDADDTWYFSVACVLGGTEYPMLPHECARARGVCCILPRGRVRLLETVSPRSTAL